MDIPQWGILRVKSAEGYTANATIVYLGLRDRYAAINLSQKGMIMETEYIVSGMTCGHCVKHVTEEVSQLDGVEKVEVVLDGGKMTITSATEIPFEAVSEAVAEAGNYTVAAA